MIINQGARGMQQKVVESSPATLFRVYALADKAMPCSIYIQTSLSLTPIPPL